MTDIYIWFAEPKPVYGGDGERFIRAWTDDPTKVASLRDAIGKEPTRYLLATHPVTVAQGDDAPIPPIFYNGDTKRDPALKVRIDAHMAMATRTASGPELQSALNAVTEKEASDSEWAPLRIWLQRGMGEEGSHTWCEDQIGEDSIGVRADALETANARITTLEQTLREIANADTAEWDDRSEFEGWAKGRARGALGKPE